MPKSKRSEDEAVSTTYFCDQWPQSGGDDFAQSAEISADDIPF
jgi:hypothetical protein